MASYRTYQTREELPAYPIPRENLLRIGLRFYGIKLIYWLQFMICGAVSLGVMLALPFNILPLTLHIVISVLSGAILGVVLFYPFNNLTSVQWLFHFYKARQSLIGNRTRQRSLSTDNSTGLDAEYDYDDDDGETVYGDDEGDVG